MSHHKKPKKVAKANLKVISSLAGKFLSDIKTSMNQIIKEYKNKTTRAQASDVKVAQQATAPKKAKVAPKAKVAKKPTTKKVTVKKANVVKVAKEK